MLIAAAVVASVIHRPVTLPVGWRIMRPVQRDLPSGTVTSLFTDVEGSTRLLQVKGKGRIWAYLLIPHP